jgi:ribonuclease-3
LGGGYGVEYSDSRDTTTGTDILQGPYRNQVAVPDEADLARLLGVQFREPKRLTEALTHRSYLHDHPDTIGEANERLEFLGDAILQFVVADILCARFPHAPEGELTALRALLVSTTALADVAERLGLHRFIRASGGEGSLAGRGRPRILAGTVEAIIAAVHKDRGIRAARTVTMRLLRPRLDAAARDVHTANVKGRLQEQLQAESGETPRYVIVRRDGPVHAERFWVEVRVGIGDGERMLGAGEGTGKRAAEHAAARDAFTRRNSNSTQGVTSDGAAQHRWEEPPRAPLAPEALSTEEAGAFVAGQNRRADGSPVAEAINVPKRVARRRRPVDARG